MAYNYRMNKSIISGIAIVLISVGGIYFLTKGNKEVSPAPKETTAADYKNATYIIEGQPVTLINGHAESAAAPGSASKIVTQYFGNQAVGDLNWDGVDDIGFLLSQTTGGSGTFYYAVAAIKTADGYQGTSAVLLGDRIAPQTTEIREGGLLINYAERAPGESFAVQPSMGKSLWLLLDTKTMKFAESAKL